ncbi:MAG: hypothetical protein IRZ00_00170 [Gemmatimonadetes bacterium]|nr:hypothetical protein [Gemmatimonadota bacterium]
MSLVPFHRVLIASAIAFFLAFAVWEVRAFLADRAAASLVAAAASAVVALLLAVYLRRLRSFLKLPPGRPVRPRP